jgi:hypothetical protein
MTASSNLSLARIGLVSWAGALFILTLAPGCAVDTTLAEAQSPDCIAGEGCAAPSGDDPASFCDDDNPCTTDVNCTPCSTLPAAERDMYHCTADADLPALCAGRTGCAHVPLTTPPEQSNDCFPVAGAADVHAGVCRAGTCAENGT